MMKILDSAMKQSKSANEISKETHISHPTGWRKIKGLIILEKIIITPDAKKFSLYHSTLRSINIKYEDTNVVMEAEPNSDITKKCAKKFFWSNNDYN
jgi:hypothetical protein